MDKNKSHNVDGQEIHIAGKYKMYEEICKCGHHTDDHSYNVDWNLFLRCDKCNCSNFRVREFIPTEKTLPKWKLEKEFDLSDYIGEKATSSIPTIWVKEFIKRDNVLITRLIRNLITPTQFWEERNKITGDELT